MATEDDQVNAKASDSAAMTYKAMTQIEASAVPDTAPSGPLSTTEEAPEVASTEPPQPATVSTPEQPNQQKSKREDIQPQSNEHFYMVLLEDVLSADQGQRARREGSDTAGGGQGGGNLAARRMAEPIEPFEDQLCGERFNRAFGLPLLGLAFLTIVLPVTMHRYSSSQNDTQSSQSHYGTSNRMYPSARPVHFNYLADRMLLASATTARHAAPWQRNNSTGIGRIILDWQRLLGIKPKTDAESTTARNSMTSTRWRNPELRESWRPGSTSRNVYGTLPTSRSVYKDVYGNDRLPYWLPPRGQQYILAETRRFFEKRSTLPTRPRDSSAAGDEYPHNARDGYDVKRGDRDQGLPYGGSGSKRDGAMKRGAPGGATTGEPVPPLSGSQLWCVYQTTGGVHDAASPDDDEYQLDDVPVSLCTAVVYCCLDVWKHGVRTYQPLTARPRGPPGGRWYDSHTDEEYKHEGDGGPQGIYHFSRLRTLRGAPPTLKLYAMLGGREQTTSSFTRKMAAGGTSAGEATSDDRDAYGGRTRHLNSGRQEAVSLEKAKDTSWNTAESRSINYTVLDKTVDLSIRWLRRMGLDGFVFNYRTDPQFPRADPLYLLYFRAFHERLGEQGLQATLVLPDAMTSNTATGSGSADRKRPRSGATSVARLVATGYTPLVLPTHDLVPQDRKLNGDEHSRNHTSGEAAPAVVDDERREEDDTLPPPESKVSPYGDNGTEAATCPAPYSSDDPAVMTQERLLTGRYGKLTVNMKLNTLVTVSFKADHYRLRSSTHYKELTPAYKVGESTYRDMCRIANGTWRLGDQRLRRPDSRRGLDGGGDVARGGLPLSPTSSSSTGRRSGGQATRSFYGSRSGCLVVQSELDWYSGFGPESARPLLLEGPGSGFLGVVVFDLEADDFAGSCGGVKHPLVRRLRRMLWLNEQRRPILPLDGAEAAAAADTSKR